MKNETTKEVWIVKGTVTDSHVYGDSIALEGMTEYQFSDGPSGKRSMSDDYVNLEQGLAEYSGYIIHWEG